MKRLSRSTYWIGGLLIALWVAVLAGRLNAISGFEPPPTVQGQSFSVGDSDPLTLTGVHAADILGAGGYPLIPCYNLGLLCFESVTGTADDLNALSFGVDFVEIDLPPLQFSVAPGSQGLVGTGVHIEANCSPPEAQTDVFETSLDGTNLQDLDGNGTACGSNQGFGLGLTESNPADQVDALERDPCQYVDANCDGEPDGVIFLTLAPGSPSLDMIGAGPADILLAAVEFVPVVWADGVTDLGLVNGDVIDALCVNENGNGIYDVEDQILFSLAPGSPTLGLLSASPADLFSPAPVSIIYTASLLGLETTDDVDALMCAAEIAITPTLTPTPTVTGTPPTLTSTPTPTITQTGTPATSTPTSTHTLTLTPPVTPSTVTPTPSETPTTPPPKGFQVFLPLILRNK